MNPEPGGGGPSRRRLALLSGCLTVAAVGWLMIAVDRFMSGRVGLGLLTLLVALVFGAQAVHWFRRHRSLRGDLGDVRRDGDESPWTRR